MPFVIDGQNLLRGVQKTFEQFADISQHHLCKLISEYMRRKRSYANIVFDGTGPRDREVFFSIENIEVEFSGQDKEADDIIEILITQNSAPKRMTVVSDDRRIISAGQRRKAIHIDCISFWIGLTDEPQKKRTPREPASKRDGITNSETEKWMKEFGL